MPSTFFGLSIAKSGLYASMGGINTTAHNISHTNTEGYCRQVMGQTASSALKVNATYGMAGSGVDITGVSQMRDIYYDLKFRSNSTMAGEYVSKQHYMSEIESYFNEINLEGFTTSFNSMFDTLQELSKNPSDLSCRTQVTNYGQSLAEYFNSMATSLKAIQEEANFEIKNQADRVTALGQQIAVLTKQINTIESNGGTANDLRDERNLRVDELSTICNITVSENIVGEDVGVTSYQVKIDGYTLVDTYEYNKLIAVPQKHQVNQMDADGMYKLMWSTGQEFNSASAKLGGTLSSLFQVRDGNNGEAFKGKADVAEGDTTITVTMASINDAAKLTIAPQGVITVGHREYEYTGFVVREDEDGNYEYEFTLSEDTPITKSVDEAGVIIGRDVHYKGIPYYMSQLNEWVRTFAKEFNEVHTSGEDLKGRKGLDFFNGSDQVTGMDYVFGQSEEDEEEGIILRSTAQELEDELSVNYGNYYLLTAANFKVTSEVYADPYKVAAASSITDGVENSDVAKKLIALKLDSDMFRQGTPGGFFQTFVAEIGIDSAKAQQFAKNQENICASITNQRLSVSGVDTEEEAMNLIRYRMAYNLSAQAVTVMNQIYDKLINYMGA